MLVLYKKTVYGKLIVYFMPDLLVRRICFLISNIFTAQIFTFPDIPFLTGAIYLFLLFDSHFFVLFLHYFLP